MRRAAPFVLALTIAAVLSACSPDNDRAVVTRTVVLQVEADGTIEWNGDKIDEAELNRRFDVIAKLNRPPDIRFVPDRGASYESVARVLAAAQRSGVTHIGFTGIENDH